MSKHYKYPLKVWLTSALLGTVLAVVIDYISSLYSFVGTLAYQLKSTWELASTFLTILLLAIITTIPTWLIFWFVYTRLLKANKAAQYIRFWLVITAVVLCLLTFAIIAIVINDMDALMRADILMPYLFAAALCAWVYFPKQVSIDIPHATSS